MSESTITPVRTSKDLVNCFDIHDGSDQRSGFNSDNENARESQQKEKVPSYQNWRENLMMESDDLKSESKAKKSLTQELSKSIPDKNTSSKKSKNIDLLLRHSPQKMKINPQVPVLSYSHLQKSPMTSKSKESKGMFSSKKQKPSELNGSAKQKKGNATSRLVSSDLKETYLSSVHKEASIQNALSNNTDLIKEVEKNKEELKSKKSRLEGLEKEIVSISDKMTKYRNETNEIIEQLQSRIQE